MKELEELKLRELNLEHIIQNMYDGFIRTRNILPFTDDQLDYIDNVMVTLYNAAEIREDLEDYGQLELILEV